MAPEVVAKLSKYLENHATTGAGNKTFPTSLSNSSAIFYMHAHLNSTCIAMCEDRMEKGNSGQSSLPLGNIKPVHTIDAMLVHQ